MQQLDLIRDLLIGAVGLQSRAREARAATGRRSAVSHPFLRTWCGPWKPPQAAPSACRALSLTWLDANGSRWRPEQEPRGVDRSETLRFQTEIKFEVI